jgi:hypothetical protein
MAWIDCREEPKRAACSPGHGTMRAGKWEWASSPRPVGVQLRTLRFFRVADPDALPGHAGQRITPAHRWGRSADQRSLPRAGLGGLLTARLGAQGCVGAVTCRLAIRAAVSSRSRPRPRAHRLKVNGTDAQPVRRQARKMPDPRSWDGDPAPWTSGALDANWGHGGPHEIGGAGDGWQRKQALSW